MAPNKNIPPNQASLYMSLSFDEDMNMDDSSEQVTYSPSCAGGTIDGDRVIHSHSNTPKIRRLFDSGHNNNSTRSPFPRSRWQINRRLTSKAQGGESVIDTTSLNDSSTSESSMLSTGSVSLVVEGARKRAPDERTIDFNTVDGTSHNMYMSPRISPNSYLTMDGRFVQSKNPFSSPMMTDTPNQTFEYAAVGATLAPAMPTQFYNSLMTQGGSQERQQLSAADVEDEEVNKMYNSLPPRHSISKGNGLQPKGTPATQAAAGLQAFSLATSGYPDLTSKFTGSPIPEHYQSYKTNNAATNFDSRNPYRNVNNTNNNNITLQPINSNDTASQGSLRKVRRIHRGDDVVAATGHHLSRLSTTDLSVDTYMGGADDDSLCGLSFGEEISPTEVAHFPTLVIPPVSSKAPPPTPMKQRPTMQPYSCLARTNTTPGPPILTRKGMVRTPHPGLWMNPSREHPLSVTTYDDDNNNNNNNNASNNDTIGTCKSRFHSDFDVIGELGQGSFGTVFKVLSRLDGCMYAIKAAQRKAKGPADRGRMLKEVYALAALSDQADTANFHIVRYHQAWMEDDRLYIQTELCSGTLGDEITTRGPLSSQRRYKLLRELLLALEFIHRNNMVHLDIKPENVFLKNDQYKLGDFGLVTKVSTEQEIEEGDSRYMSMELLSGDRSDLTKSDIFSLGATLYEICLGRTLPMNGPEWQDIRAGRLSPVPADDPDMIRILQQMMDPVMCNRPTATVLLQHPQLLSDEQKALHVEKTKVLQANIQLAAQARFAAVVAMPAKRTLQRANTWSGLPSYL